LVSFSFFFQIFLIFLFLNKNFKTNLNKILFSKKLFSKKENENEKENEKTKRPPSSVYSIVYPKNTRVRGTWSQGWVGTGVWF
jgi:hypothetical protein